jgi:hypothetical protein
VTTLACDPVLDWTAIAAHARQAHGARWDSDDAAITAIVGAFDAIMPSGYSYDPARGAIRPAGPQPPVAPPSWEDTQMLGCAVATLAAAATCDLQAIYGTENLIA